MRNWLVKLTRVAFIAAALATIIAVRPAIFVAPVYAALENSGKSEAGRDLKSESGLAPTSGEVQDSGKFSVSPTSFSVNLNSLQDTNLSFYLKNSLKAELVFNLGLSDSDKKGLSDIGLQVMYKNEGGATNLLDGDAKITIDPDSEQELKLILSPKHTQDYNRKFNVNLTQAESENRLSIDVYELKLEVASKLGSQVQAGQQDLFIAGGVLTLSVLGYAAYLLYQKLRG